MWGEPSTWGRGVGGHWRLKGMGVGHHCLNGEKGGHN